MELTRQQKVFTFVGTLLGLFLGALDQTIVATAGPTIQQDLAIPPALYVWLTTSFTLASTVFVPIWAKLSDLYGRRVIIIAGISIFLSASVLCGLSQSTLQLILFRGLQGLGSASLFTTAFAVVADMFSPAERGKYSGIFGGVFGLASLIGPIAGGFITHRFGWHWVFFINLPVGALALFFIITRMPPLTRVHTVPPKVDFIGAVMLACGIVPILIALSLGRAQVIPGWSWTDWRSLSLFGGGLFTLVAFFFFERTRAQPLIDFSLFRLRVFAVGNASVFVLGGVFLSPMIFLPLYMMRVVGVSETKAGLSLLPLVIGVILGNVVSGQVTSRLGRYKAPMLVGLTMLLGGLSVMAFSLRADSTLSEVTVKMVFVGLGLGPAIPLYTIAIQNAIPPGAIGSATGVATFFRQMGGTLGIAVAGTLFATVLADGMAERMKGATPLGTLGAISEDGVKARSKLDLESAKANVRAQLEGARGLGAKALQGDELAAAQLGQGPFTSPALKDLMAGGGPRARMKRITQGQWERIVAASTSSQAWTALSHAPDMPQRVRAVMEGAPPGEASLARVHSELELSDSESATIAVEQARETLEGLLISSEKKSEAEIDGSVMIFKEAFTAGVRAVYRFALGLALIAMLLTLALPSLPLRRGPARFPEAPAKNQS